MNNEEKILQILMEMQTEQRKTNGRLDKLEAGQAELRQEMNERFDILEANMKFAWQDIAFVEKRVQQHEKEFHNVG